MGGETKNPRELTKVISGFQPGSVARIKLLRNNQPKVFSVELTLCGEKEESIHHKSTSMKKAINEGGDKGEISFQKTAQKGLWGIWITTLTSEIAKRCGIIASTGVVVAKLDFFSRAKPAGLLKYDIIKEINHKPIHSENDYHKIIGNIPAGGVVEMYACRIGWGCDVVKIIK